MKSADWSLNRAIFDAIESGLKSSSTFASGIIRQAIPETPESDDLIVLLSETETETRPHKYSSHSGNTQTVRCFALRKSRAKQMAALVIDTCTSTKLDLTRFGFRLKEKLQVDMNEPINQTTSTGKDFSQVVRLRGPVQPIA